MIEKLDNEKQFLAISGFTQLFNESDALRVLGVKIQNNIGGQIRRIFGEQYALVNSLFAEGKFINKTKRHLFGDYLRTAQELFDTIGFHNDKSTILYGRIIGYHLPWFVEGKTYLHYDRETDTKIEYPNASEDFMSIASQLRDNASYTITEEGYGWEKICCVYTIIPELEFHFVITFPRGNDDNNNCIEFQIHIDESISRFKGLVGQDTNFGLKVLPHYHAMQQRLSEKIAEFFSRHSMGDLYNSILELGTGTGYTAQCIIEHLQKRGNKKTRINSVDINPFMIRRSEANFYESIQSGRVCLIQKDILAYLEGQGKDTLGAVASSMTLHNFEKTYRTQVLQRIYETLVQGGLFINADKYALDDPKKHQSTLDRQIEQFKKVAQEESNPAFVKERTDHYLRDNEPDILMKQQVAIDEMKRIGFKDIKIIFRSQMEAILVARK